MDTGGHAIAPHNFFQYTRTWTNSDNLSILSSRNRTHCRGAKTTAGRTAKFYEQWERLKQWIDAPIIEWADIFWEINSGYATDERFGYRNFGDCPDFVIFDALKFYRDRYQQKINAQSISTAIGFSGVFSAFGGKISPQELLPFQIEKEKQKIVSDRTAAIIRRIYKSGEVSPVLLGAIVDLIDNVFKGE